MKAKINKAPENERLPAGLDNEGVIFSYGSLLEHSKLRELLKKREHFEIFETNSPEEAAILVNSNPNDIVIIKNVRLENVRVSIVTERILRRWYENIGGDVQKLIDVGITSAEIPRALFLYARPAESNEKGRNLNGGLICNLSRDDLSTLDNYEWKPVLNRTRVSQLTIGNRSFLPNYITFYAGSEPSDNITSAEKNERSKLLNLNRNRGNLSPQAKWQRNVRCG